ncbi:MAG: glycogen debranching protein, partial [Acidobacteriota bacterium]
TPAIRGLFGLEADALHHTLRVRPQLPAAWQSAALHHVAVGGTDFDLTFRKENGTLAVEASSPEPQLLCLTGDAACGATSARTHRLELKLPAFAVNLPYVPPPAGSPSVSAKILAQSENGFEIEGLASSVARVDVRFTRAPAEITGAALDRGQLIVRFPAGTSWQRTTVHFIW